MALETPILVQSTIDPNNNPASPKELLDSDDDECDSVSSFTHSVDGLDVGTPEVSEDAPGAVKVVDELKLDGNRLFGLGRYAEAVEVYERGLAAVAEEREDGNNGIVAATFESNIAAVRQLVVAVRQRPVTHSLDSFNTPVLHAISAAAVG
jgi:hypothetical protein